MRIKIAVFLAVPIACVLFQKGRCDDNILSQATGIDGIREIAGDPARQLDLEISPVQLEKLKQLLKDERVKTTYANVYFALEADVRSSSPEKSEFAAKRAVDDLIRGEIARILLPEQLAAWRVSCLRRSFSGPDKVFDPRILVPLGLEDDDSMRESFGRVKSLSKEFDRKLLDEQILAIRRSTTGLSIEKLHRIESLFGIQIAGTGSKPNGDTDHNKIALLDTAQGFQQIRLTQKVQIPPELSLATEQRGRLVDLWNSEAKKIAKKEPSSARSIDAKLNEILSEKQRYAVVQGIQLMSLRDDLNVLCDGRVAAFVELSEVDLKNLRTQLKKEIPELLRFRRAGELLIFNSSLKMLPKGKQPLLVDLIEGVWPTP